MTSVTAYALADRDAGRYFPGIRDVLGHHDMSLVSLSAMQQAKDPYLSRFAGEARAAGIKSAIRIEGASGKAAADVGRAAVNQFYQTDAYRPGDTFTGGVVYQEGGRTVEDTGTFRPRFGRN